MKALIAAAAAAAFTLFAVTSTARSDSPEDINRSSDVALQRLNESNPAVQATSEHARAIPIFPSIVKAGDPSWRVSKTDVRHRLRGMSSADGGPREFDHAVA
jgi:hypothetical protein